MGAGERADSTQRLIELLYLDATLSNAELGNEAGMSEEEVDRRIKELVDKGAIQGFQAVPDPRGLGFHVMGYLFVECRENYDAALKETVENIDQWTGTQSAWVVLGDMDIMIRRIDPSLSDLDVFAENALNHSKDYYHPETYGLTQIIRIQGVDFPQEAWRRFDANPLDSTQKEVLQFLQRNARLRGYPGEIAKELDIDAQTVTRTVDYLEDEGYIRGYSIGLNPRPLNWLRAFVGISTHLDKYDEVVEELKRVDYTDKVGPAYIPYIVSGLGQNWADLAVEIHVDSIEHLDGLTDYIRTIHGIESTRTYLATKTLHDNGHVPVE